MAVTKEQLSIILLKSLFGSAYVPTTATGSVFSDVVSDDFAASWIEELSNQSITEGCDASNFCPKQAVTFKSFIQMLNKTFPNQ